MTNNPFDKAGRFLIRWDPFAFLCWALKLSPDELKFVRWLDTRNTPFLTSEDRTCDTIAFVLDQRANGVPWAIIIEFQIAPDSDIFGRLMIYGGAVHLHQKPYPDLADRFHIGAIVINPTGTGNHSLDMQFSGDTLRTTLKFREVNVGEFDAFETMTAIEDGSVPLVVLPLIPLMRNGDDTSIIPRWIAMASTVLQDKPRNDLGIMVKMFAEATDCVAVWQKGLEGWNVKRSLYFEELQREARKDAITAMVADAYAGKSDDESDRITKAVVVEASRDLVSILLSAKFGVIPPTLADAIQGQQDAGVLRTWVANAGISSSLDEFREKCQLP